MFACTAFGIYGSSGVLVAQRCTCACLYSVRRVLPEPYAYRVHTVRVRVRSSAVLLLLASARAWHAPYTFICTVFGKGSLSDTPFVGKPAFLGVHTVHVGVQYWAWAA